MQTEKPPINPDVFAKSVRTLLTEDRCRYRNFGMYWYFVKALLKTKFNKDDLYLLGDHEDPSVIARMPQGISAADTLVAAVEEYRHNAMFNLGRNVVVDDDGEQFTLLDPDAGGF
ncbi:MAG: hypothetical protein ACHQRJ_19635 [Alphaproteobacteria bacterium]